MWVTCGSSNENSNRFFRHWCGGDYKWREKRRSESVEMRNGRKWKWKGFSFRISKRSDRFKKCALCLPCTSRCETVGDNGHGVRLAHFCSEASRDSLVASLWMWIPLVLPFVEGVELAVVFFFFKIKLLSIVRKVIIRIKRVGLGQLDGLG